MKILHRNRPWAISVRGRRDPKCFKNLTIFKENIQTYKLSIPFTKLNSEKFDCLTRSIAKMKKLLLEKIFYLKISKGTHDQKSNYLKPLLSGNLDGF